MDEIWNMDKNRKLWKNMNNMGKKVQAFSSNQAKNAFFLMLRNKYGFPYKCLP
jgi:hypothetical protein